MIVTGRLDINTKSFRLKLIQSRCKWSHVLDLKNEEYITFLFTRKLYLKWLKFSCTFISWVRIETTYIERTCIETTYKPKRNDLFLVSCILTRPTGLPKYGVTRKNILRYDTLNRPIRYIHYCFFKINNLLSNLLIVFETIILKRHNIVSIISNYFWHG